MRRLFPFIERVIGEEFAVILPATEAADAATMAERIRAAVQERGLVHQGNPPAGVVTISVGVATKWPTGSGEVHQSLISAADRALYQAKEGGRNRVVPSRRDEAGGAAADPNQIA